MSPGSSFFTLLISSSNKSINKNLSNEFYTIDSELVKELKNKYIKMCKINVKLETEHKIYKQFLDQNNINKILENNYITEIENYKLIIYNYRNIIILINIIYLCIIIGIYSYFMSYNI